jgi:hypothetical protein
MMHDARPTLFSPDPRFCCAAGADEKSPTLSRAVVGLAGVLGVVYACAAGAADPVLAPTGTLRAAYIVANLAQARLDSGTG